MITIYKTDDAKITKGKYFTTEEKGYELRGLSTDDKPTDVPNGSIFIEMDTSNLYIYDLENEEWYKISGNGGGGNVKKYDYIIPAGLYEDVTGAISDEEIIEVLDTIDDDYLDADGKIKPLTIGIYLGNDDQSMEGYFSSCVQIGSAGGHVILSFISNVDYPCIVMIYYSSGWKIGSSAI